MSGLVGADIAQLRTLAKQMSSGQRSLQGRVANISNLVNSAGWEGADAEGFRQDWNTDLKKRILQTAKALDEASKQLRLNADEQQKASSGGSSSGGGPAGADAAGSGSRSGTVSRVVDAMAGAMDWGTWGDVGNAGATVLGVASDMKIDAVDAAGLLDDAGKLKPGMVGSGILKGLRGLSILGNVAGGISVLDGAFSAYQGFESGNTYAGVDGVVTSVLGGASLIPGPIGWTAAGLGLAWMGLDYLSGDVPVSKRIVDFGQSAGNAIADGAEAAWDWAFG